MATKSSSNNAKPTTGNSKSPRDTAALKPGSNPDDAKAVGGSGDFGAKASDSVERDYASHSIKGQDKGATGLNHPTASDGLRVSGAGAPASGPGSGSGGDLDPEVTTTDGIGLSNNPEIANSEGDSPRGVGRSIKPRQVNPDDLEAIVTGRDDVDNDGRGADAVRTGDRDDDSFSGELSSAEADGRDEAGL